MDKRGAKSSTPAVTTAASKVNRISSLGKDNNGVTNQVPIGATYLNLDTVRMITENGEVVSLCLQYDQGAQNSTADSFLLRSLCSSVPAKYSISTISGEADSSSERFTLRLLNANDEVVEVQALGVENLSQTHPPRRLKTPSYWEDLQLPEGSLDQEGGKVALILAADVLHLHPDIVRKSPDKRLWLGRSCLSDNFVVSGYCLQGQEEEVTTVEDVAIPLEKTIINRLIM